MIFGRWHSSVLCLWLWFRKHWHWEERSFPHSAELPQSAQFDSLALKIKPPGRWQSVEFLWSSGDYEKCWELAFNVLTWTLENHMHSLSSLHDKASWFARALPVLVFALAQLEPDLEDVRWLLMLSRSQALRCSCLFHRQWRPQPSASHLSSKWRLRTSPRSAATAPCCTGTPRRALQDGLSCSSWQESWAALSPYPLYASRSWKVNSQ